MSLSQQKGRALGRLELLAWLNHRLESDYSKIDDLADGVAFCQLFDALLPGRVSLTRINFDCVRREERVKNLKILAAVFQNHGIQHEVPVERLADGSFYENYEFLQWCHDYIESNASDMLRHYPADERRRSTVAESPTQAGSVKAHSKSKWQGSCGPRPHGHAKRPPRAPSGRLEKERPKRFTSWVRASGHTPSFSWRTA